MTGCWVGLKHMCDRKRALYQNKRRATKQPRTHRLWRFTMHKWAVKTKKKITNAKRAAKDRKIIEIKLELFGRSL